MECIVFTQAGVRTASSLSGVKGRAWIDLPAPSGKELSLIQERFKIHPLTIEDGLKRDLRPKIDIFPNYAFIVFKALDFSKAGVPRGSIKQKHLSILLGKDFLITIHPEPLVEMDKIKNEVRKKGNAAAARGIDFLLYEVLDSIVDDYFSVIDELEDQMEELELKSVGRPSPNTLRQIFHMRKTLIQMRKTLWPEREVITALGRLDIPFIQAKNRVYFRDVHDHLYQIIDMNEGNRDLVAGVLDIYLSSVSNNLNQVMKVLTVLASLVLVPTFITGVFGMNFPSLPWLHDKDGWVFPLGIMAGAITLMLLVFKQKKWI